MYKAKGRRGTWGQMVNGGRVGTWGREKKPLEVNKLPSFFGTVTCPEILEMLQKQILDCYKLDPRFLTTVQEPSAAEYQWKFSKHEPLPPFSCDFWIDWDEFKIGNIETPREKTINRLKDWVTETYVYIPNLKGGTTMKETPNYMSKDTLEALDKSIDKWWNILVSGKSDRNTRDCALCDEFEAGVCRGCPVRVSAGKKNCAGTPFTKWSNHHADAHGNVLGDKKVLCPECAELARAEHHFLVSLKPEPHEITYTLEEALRLGWRVQRTNWEQPLKTEIRYTYNHRKDTNNKKLYFWNPKDNKLVGDGKITKTYWSAKNWVVHKDGFYPEPRLFTRTAYSSPNFTELKSTKIVEAEGPLMGTLPEYVKALVDERLEEIARDAGTTLIINNKPGIEGMVGKLAHRTAPAKNAHGDRSRMDSPVRIIDVSPTTIYFRYTKKYDACFGDDLRSLDRKIWGDDWALWPEQ